MSLKRRDNKNRILRVRESQMRDGRYCYTYSVNGKQKRLYSWKLEKTDSLPKGKRECVALRDQIAELNRLQLQGISLDGGKLTVYDLTERYVATRKGVKNSTRTGYKTVLNFLKKDDFGTKMIASIKKTDVKLWLIRLQNEDGKSYSAIHSIRGVLRPAFQMAVDDDLLMKNPFDFQLVEVIINDSVRREALSREDERRFLEFVRNDKHYSKYYDGIFLLFKTGLRISEFCGLTVRDIDLNNGVIHIDHQLQRNSDMEYSVETTKTNAGTRDLPMSDEVYECCRRILEKRRSPKVEPMIDGYSKFLFLDKNGMPKVALHWEHYFQGITKKYNSIYKAQLPKVTPHVCRHTYCTNQAKSGMNPKTLQYIMGHSEIGVTLNTYTHVGFEDAKESISKMDKKTKGNREKGA